jgi:hypothetical protein
MPVLELHPELRVRQSLVHGAFDLYDIFFSQGASSRLRLSLLDSKRVAKCLKPNGYTITPTLPGRTPPPHSL